MHWVSIVSLSMGLSFAAAPFACAALGEAAVTVEQDRIMLNGTARVEPNAGFSVHVLEAQGSTVREYLSSDGIVFGLVWKHHAGPLNLEQLFGSYYEEYSRAMTVQPRRSHRIETERVIVERGGRMGATWGRVWIPALLPPGMSKDELR